MPNGSIRKTADKPQCFILSTFPWAPFKKSFGCANVSLVGAVFLLLVNICWENSYATLFTIAYTLLLDCGNHFVEWSFFFVSCVGGAIPSAIMAIHYARCTL